ncbi:putative Cobaltochelatase [Sterolibacterium denitrificans]|uniref:Cobaltochelatase n=1 Tax=Sterolibacterium denitrificans TaxID=157592 RepID=A0A7Z7HNA7_9PROT|nr:cobaltochelatase subunit CobN [Sterolibacterium denitrificans]SMB21094.1 putative Cobaltochelatase [Sterolibacterium denitrificans]
MKSASLLALVLYLLCSVVAHAAPAAPTADRVLFFSPIMGKPSQQAKYAAFARTAAGKGMSVDHRFTDEVSPEAARALFAQYRIVIFDALSGPDSLAPVASAYGRAVAANPGLIAVAAGLPGTPLTQNAPEGIEGELHPYLQNGGQENFSRLHKFLKVRLLGEPGKVEPPLIFPQEALYHPDAPQLIFKDTESYLRWRPAKPGQATVAVIFHRNHLAADSLAPVDATIRALEKRGLAVLPYYSDIVSDYLGEKFLMKDGKPRAQVVITHQAMIIDAEKVRAQAARIGVPILHALHYRDGDVEVWKKDLTGIHLTQVPMTLVMPEIIGFIDPMIVAAQDARTKRMELIPAQLDALVGKAVSMTRLAQRPNADKKLALFFYNYPPGTSNLGAAFLDIPKSLAALTQALQQRGYSVEPRDAEFFEKDALATLAPYYSKNVAADVPALVKNGYAALWPVAAYRRWYDRLPHEVRAGIEKYWGAPEKSHMTVMHQGQRHFVIPRVALGNVIVLPQPRRNESENSQGDAQLYHDTKVPVTHSYLATYLWLREQVGVDALVHLGTHGTQEWLHGKERGLSVYDDPYLILGDTPVFYPYIADNLAEGIQARRRGRATLISHLTPPFAVTGTFDEMSEISRLINEHASAGVESLKEKVFQNILDKVIATKLYLDMDWESREDNARARAVRDPEGFLDVLHDFLLGLSNQAQPLGNHTLGRLPKREHMVSTLALMLGKDFLVAADGPEAANTRDYKLFETSNAARLLAEHVIDGKPLDGVSTTLRLYLETARGHYANFQASDEIGSLLAGLEGHYIPTGYGGDVVRNPDLLPTGRNMYAFDPAKVPTRSAWETGKQLAEQTIADYRKQHGRYPEKLVFNLWSLETMRHFGVMEAQILALMGARPVWNETGMLNDNVAEMVRDRLRNMPEFISRLAVNTLTGDRLLKIADYLPERVKSKIPLARMHDMRNIGRDDIIGVEAIPASELNRPRIDVVISVTGLYRDTFPGPMKRLAEAVKKVAELDERDNFIRRNTQSLRQMLAGQGLAGDEAEMLSTVRVFSSQVGQYGNGVSEVAAASDTWETDDTIARSYLNTLGYYFGADEKRWGEKRAGLDLYAKNLAGSDAVMFSRTSNLYGLLTSDDPYGYFGALSLVIRKLSGKSPDSLIANLRSADDPRMEPTARFMAQELKGRQFHPQWIVAQRDQGYSGTLNVLDAVENFWGWQVVDPNAVREDQWQEFHDVYVRDKLKLGTREWFEEKNPRALAQIAERMLEANRKGYWQADAATLKELVEVVEDAMRRHGFEPMNEKVMPFVEQLKSSGYGLDFVTPAPGKVAAQPPQIEGQRLERQDEGSAATPPADLPAFLVLALVLLAVSTAAGALRQAGRLPTFSFRFPTTTHRSFP